MRAGSPTQVKRIIYCSIEVCGIWLLNAHMPQTLRVCDIAVYALNFAALRYMRSRKNICAGMSIVRCRVRARWRSSYLISGSLAALILVLTYTRAVHFACVCCTAWEASDGVRRVC